MKNLFTVQATAVFSCLDYKLLRHILGSEGIYVSDIRRQDAPGSLKLADHYVVVASHCLMIFNLPVWQRYFRLFCHCAHCRIVNVRNSLVLICEKNLFSDKFGDRDLQ